MENSLDLTYLKYYYFIKGSFDTSNTNKLHFISVLRNYLVLLGREDVNKLNIPLKIHVRTVWEILLSLVTLLRTTWKLNRNKSSLLILVNEPSHFKQVIGIKNYLDNHNPVFITSKKICYKQLKEEYPNVPILLLPNIFIQSKKLSLKEFEKTLNNFELATDSATLHNMYAVTSMQWYNYVYIKRTIKILHWFNTFKLCLVFNDLTTTGRMLSIALKETTTCKTAYVMHGLLSDECIESFHITDYFLLFGDYTRPILAKHQVKEEQMFIMGTPYLEQYLNKPLSGQVKQSLQPKIKSNKKIALVLLSGRGHTTSTIHHNKLIKVLHRTIAQHQNEYYFIFKLHKKDYDTHYQEILDDVTLKENVSIYPFDYFNGKDIIFEWIDIADVVITGASTSALEAMYLKKPVITIDLMKEYESETQYIQAGASYHCCDEATLSRYLEMLYNKNFPIKPESTQLVKSYFSTPTQLHSFFQYQFPRLINQSA